MERDDSGPVAITELAGWLTGTGKNGAHPENEIAELIGAFYDAVVAAHRFSWMGLFQTRDEAGVLNFIFVLEQHRGSRNRLQSAKERTAFLPIFARLSVGLRPSIFLNLYYTEPLQTTDRVSVLSEDLRHRYGGSTTAPALRWERELEYLAVS